MAIRTGALGVFFGFLSLSAAIAQVPVYLVPPPDEMAAALPTWSVFCEIRDADNAPVPADPVDGMISVSCSTAARVTVWGGIKSLYG
jgi:hypothetical protein